MLSQKSIYKLLDLKPLEEHLPKSILRTLPKALLAEAKASKFISPSKPKRFIQSKSCLILKSCKKQAFAFRLKKENKWSQSQIENELLFLSHFLGRAPTPQADDPPRSPPPSRSPGALPCFLAALGRAQGSPFGGRDLELGAGGKWRSLGVLGFWGGRMMLMLSISS